MADSAVTLTATSPFKALDQSTVEYFFSVDVGTGNYVTGGNPFSFAGLVVAPGAPLEVRAFSNDAPPIGYTYAYNPGSPADQGSGSLMVFLGGVEAIGGAATPAPVVADSIMMVARFAR